MPERARTDPWEPQGSNPLGPPGPQLRARMVASLQMHQCADASRAARPAQKLSALMTSPPATVPSACQTARLIEFLMNWTCPSAKRELTPPECALRAAILSDSQLQRGSERLLCGKPPRQSGSGSVGPRRWLYMLCPGAPKCHRTPRVS